MKPYFKKALCLFLLLAVSQIGVAAPSQPGITPNILILGDSLSAAYGMQRAQGWVALLGDKLEDEGYPHTLVNASISGETTSGGLRRLPALLQKHEPEIVILELGANDGLRALSIDAMRENLAAMIKQSQAAGARVLLLGMRIPSNYGPAYTESFHAVFGQIFKQYDTAVVDFFLAPIALQQDYFQDDRIHPNPKAQPLLLGHVWSSLTSLLDNERRSD